jgi:hypothetical protein
LASDDNWIVDAGFVPCCEGQGGYYDEARRIYKRCSLVDRLRELNRLYKIYRSKAPAPTEKQTKQLHSAAGQSVWSLMCSTRQSSGGLIPLDSAPLIDPCWLYAFGCAWRFGERVLLCDLSLESSFQQKLHDDRFLQSLDVIIVCGIGELSQPRSADYFEMMVGLAYHGELRFMMEAPRSVIPVSREPVERGFSTKGAFSRKLREIKAKNPLEYLHSDCRSRLASLCQQESWRL